MMKKEYRKPAIKKIDYAFEEQVMAQYSFPTSGWADPSVINACTYDHGMCYDKYNVMVRTIGPNSCKEQGSVPGVVVPDDLP